MPGHDFVGPAKSFSVEDAKHARLAIGGATRSERAGKISAAEADRIKAKARAKAGKGKPKKLDIPPLSQSGSMMAGASELTRLFHFSFASIPVIV